MKLLLLIIASIAVLAESHAAMFANTFKMMAQRRGGGGATTVV